MSSKSAQAPEKFLIGALILILIVVAGFYLIQHKKTAKWAAKIAPILATEKTFHGVSFNYAKVANNVTQEIIPAQPFTEPQPGGSGNAETMQFLFDPVQGQPVYTPNAKVLRIYPTDQYVSWLNTNSFQVSDWGPDALKTILQNQSPTPGQIPVAPVPNASQVYQAQVQYLPFSGGTGVRFVTSYAQDVSPITNDDLIYIYQGLTNDGKYWVSLYYPVTTAALPNSIQDTQVTGENYDVFAKNYTTYISDLTTKLNNLTPDDFGPSLNGLDSMVKSLTIPPNTDIFAN